MRKQDMVKVNVRMDPEKHRRLKSMASGAGVSLQTILERAVDAWINRRVAREEKEGRGA